MDLGDYFSFEVARTSRLDELIGGIAVRYKVTANFDGRRFEQVVVDVGFDQYISSSPDLIRGPDYFSFAGIPPIQVPTLPLAQHVAEKLHAYTRIYSDGRQSSRVKDLIDLVLIAQNSPFEAERLGHAITSTFSSRQTQLLPDAFPRPPVQWLAPYRAMADEVGLDPDVATGHALAAPFLDPILNRTIPGNALWIPEQGIWQQDLSDS